MGSGKTTYFMDGINRSFWTNTLSMDDGLTCEFPRFLYVTPFLEEVERVQDHCSVLDFRDPAPVKGKKLNHLLTLIEAGANIATTHALFRLLTKEMHEAIQTQNYVLILDEVITCVEPFDGISKDDQEMLMSEGKLLADPMTGHVRWGGDHVGYKGKHEDVMRLAQNGNLTLYRERLLQLFPTDFLTCFSHVYILTYLFEGSPMSAYLRSHGVEYVVRTLHDGQLVPKADYEVRALAKLEPMVSVYEGKANRWGQQVGENPFSAGWLNRQKDDVLSQVRRSVEYWFKNIARTPSSYNAYTTLKGLKSKLKGMRYTKGFIPCNARATNKYRDKASVAYLFNVYPNPLVEGYLRETGMPMDKDVYALSELVQWLWRSRIRDGHPIKVFIPSLRMRTLLKDWLSGRFCVTARHNIRTYA